MSLPLTALTALSPGQAIMMFIGGLLIYLAIAKGYEPVLLLPIGFGAIVANIPFSSAIGEHGALTLLFETGIMTELFPVLIFIGIGAMIDFGPLIKNPVMMLYGAAAQFGIFATMIVATLFGFPLNQAAAIGIIGAADGPTTIYVATKLAPQLLAPLSVAAYSYMSLVPIIQPAVIRFLTTPAERRIHMTYEEGPPVSRTARILFPIIVTVVAGLIAPISVALIGLLMFGNLIRECGVLDRLSRTAQQELTNLVTLLLGITIGATMEASSFLRIDTLLVLAMGLVAFVFDTAGGVIFAKVLNLFLRRKVNPMIGAAGISAFPMSGRLVAKMALAEDPTNYLIMHSIGANVAGQIGSVIAGGLVLTLVAQGVIG